MGDVELPQWLKALPQAPEFHPTEAEFADPIAYILKVEEEAKEFGICKIIPPFTKAAKKVVVNNLNRSLSLSIEQVQVAAQGNGGALTRSMGGIHLAKPKGLALDTSTGSDGKAKFATRRQQLGWNPKRNRGVAHSQNHKLVWQSGESYTLEQFEAKAKLFSRTRLGTFKDVPPLSVESLFWRAAAEKPISIEYANDIPGSAFSESADSISSRLKKRKRGFEEADNRCQDNISASCRIEEKVEEEEKPACSDEFESSDAMKSKNSGLEAGGDNAGAAGSKLANSSWNMRNVARSQGSLLRFMPEEVPGVTSPMVYIGMLFSWFAWHVEDHELHSLNYLHMGASKTWYAVPGDAAPALEEAIRVHGYGGHLNPRAAFSLLGEKTTVMSPEVLVAAGVPCCRLVQNAGEYVVTFPRAYHLGFSHGFNCGEAANFATPGWLEVAKEAAARRAAMNYLPMLSHQQLLYHLTMSLPPRIPTSAPSEPRSSRLKVKKKSLGDEMVKGVFLDDVMHNNQLLHILLDKGVSRCLRAKNTKRVSASLAFFERLENESFVPIPGAVEGPQQPLVSKARSQGCNGFEASNTSGQRAGNAEDSGDRHLDRQPPAGLAVASVGDNAVESPYTEALASPSARSEVLANVQGGLDTDGQPGHGKYQKTKGALAVDWGTLPCAACGILCFATMAVVEPTSTSAMTFKPIYAAAGLGHCALETKDTGRMDIHLQKQTYENPTLVVDLSHDVVQDGHNALQKLTCDGKQEVEHLAMSNLPCPVESSEAKMKSGLVGAVDAPEESRPLDSHGMRIVAEGPEVATQEECGGDSARGPCSASDLGATSVNCGIDVINRNVSTVVISPSSCGHLEEQDDKSSTVRFDDQLDEVETCGDKGNYTAAESIGSGGKFSVAPVSSLQLLASVYEEGSDLEDEDVDEPAEDEKNACDLTEGSEVLGKPQNSAGDLLTDEVGLSTDVPWLSLAPLTDPTLLPPPKVISPMFTFSSLTDGPRSLEKVFVSSGFAFGDVASADNLGPVLSEEQLEKQSGDVPSKELVLNCSTSCVDGEEDVKDAMQELYCRINYQALTKDTEGDNEMLLPFIGRPGIFSMTREVVKHECTCRSREHVATYHSFGPPEMDPTCDPLFDKISCLTSSAPSNKDLVAESESKECGIPSATQDVCKQRSVSKLYEQTSVNSRSTLTSNHDAVACPPTMDQNKELGPIPAPERKRAWSSVARPRVLCLEHAVEAQEQLRSLGGAQIVVVCHSDFENYECRARSLAQEFGSDHKWTRIPFSDEVDDEVRMVNAAVDIEEDDGRRVSDWVMQMGLFIHHRFRERECESSDDSQHGNDDFRAGPFTRIKSGRPGRKKLMASRVGLSRKPDDYPKAFSKNSSQITPIDSLLQPKVSKKKKATVAGRWCGRVWRMNQVHPFLGGNRKVDPSLQLGMSSTSLYALSAMPEIDGNKYRKGTSSSRLESFPSSVLIPIKSAEDEQIAVLRKRGKEQKVIQPGILLPIENGNRTQKDIDTMATAYPQHSLALYTAQVENDGPLPCPVLGTPAEKRNGSEQVGNLSTNDEFCSLRDSQRAEDGFARLAHGPDVVQAETSRSDGKVRQMLALKPLASRDPRAEEAVNNSSNFRTLSPAQDVCGVERGALDKHLSSMESFGGKNNRMATRTIEPLPSASVSVQMPTDVIRSADVKAFRFHPSAFPLPAFSIHAVSASEEQAGSGGHRSSTLPLINRVDTSNGGSSVTATGYQGGACQWRDVPVVYPQAFHPAMTRCSRQVINQLVSPTPNINHNQLYIPYSSNPPMEAVSDHAFAGQTSDNGKLYSVVSQTFGSLEQGGTKLNSTHLMQSLMATSSTAVENLEQESRSSSGSPLLLSELGNTLEYLPAQHGAGVKRKRERQISGLIGRVSEEVLCEVDNSQLSSHDVKNIIRLPDNNGQLTSDDGPVGLTEIAHLHESGKVEGQSSPGGADLLRVPGVQQTDCLVYHRKQSIAVTPILSLSPALIESCHPRSMELGYADSIGQGGALVPLTPSVPQPMARVGRSAVKARGKRAKHVGWTGYRQLQPGVSAESLLNVWGSNSQASGPPMISLQSEECVEARYEVEDCEKAIELHNHSAAGPIGIMQTLRLRGVPAVEVKKEEIKVRQERAAAKSKKKATLPKKKKVLGKKPAGEDGEFTCDLDGCRMSFPTEAELQMHKRNRCTFKGCEKRFFMHKYLLQHRRVHLDERPLKCPWKGCKQAFKWAWARTEHIRVHTGERPYACPDCDQTFRFVSDFSRHKRNTGHTKS